MPDVIYMNQIEIFEDENLVTLQDRVNRRLHEIAVSENKTIEEIITMPAQSEEIEWLRIMLITQEKVTS